MSIIDEARRQCVTPSRSIPDPVLDERTTTGRGLGRSKSRGIGLRAARTEASRAALVRAAKRVFTKVGFADAKISDISRQAKVAYGTFYTHFPSKEAIFREVIMEVHEEAFDAHRRATAAVDGDPLARISAANQQYFGAYRKNARLLASFEEVATSNKEMADIHRSTRTEYLERTARAIRDWRAQGLVRDDLDVEYVAQALGFMVERYAYMTFVFEAGHIDERRALEVVDRIWADALGLRRVRPKARPGR